MSIEVLRYGVELPRSRRAAVLTGVAVIHAALLTLAVTVAHSDPQPRFRPSLTVISIDASKAVAKVAPSLPAKTPALQPALAPALSPETTPSAATTGTAESCPTLDAVSQGILADQAAVAAVASAPSDTRSIADAIVIWNAGWSASTDVMADPSAPLAAVRSAVLTSLGTVDPGCLDQQIEGPRFIAIRVGERTRLLVFGSGAWTWSQLTSESIGLPTTTGDEARREPSGTAVLIKR